jgi:hypothetical protein
MRRKHLLDIKLVDPYSNVVPERAPQQIKFSGSVP